MISFRLILSILFIPALVSSLVSAQEYNPLFKEAKIKNYMPHMSWLEVEQALTKTDMVIIPVGSIEQHGKHLPLGTDSFAAIETCKLIAQETDVIIAPVVLSGLSEHHMGFPGSLTLSPETFEAVIFETAQSLIRHGFNKIMIYNGHGGNTQSCNNVIQRINQETGATGVFLNNISVPPLDQPYPEIPYDWHGGVSETSLMLYLTNSLVNMSRAEKPVLTFPEHADKILNKSGSSSLLNDVAMSFLFRPKDTGKKGSTREISNTGVVTSGDPNNGTAERGKKERENLIKAVVKFIEEWKEVK